MTKPSWPVKSLDGSPDEGNECLDNCSGSSSWRDQVVLGKVKSQDGGP